MDSEHCKTVRIKNLVMLVGSTNAFAKLFCEKVAFTLFVKFFAANVLKLYTVGTCIYIVHVHVPTVLPLPLSRSEERVSVQEEEGGQRLAEPVFYSRENKTLILQENYSELHQIHVCVRKIYVHVYMHVYICTFVPVRTPYIYRTVFFYRVYNIS